MSLSPQASDRPPCPFLPDCPERMDYRDLNELRHERGEALYIAALRYSQYLWLSGLTARAILALNRGLFTSLTGREQALESWPMPYKALAWLLYYHDGRGFLGNPRISYQHIADRVRGPEQTLKRVRAWACWHLVRAACPAMPGDPKHAVREPTQEETGLELDPVGLVGERVLWSAALEAARDPESAFGKPARPPGGRMTS